MNRQPLLLIGAGLLTLSVCWVVVFAMTVQPVPTPIAILSSPVASSGASLAGSATLSPSAVPVPTVRVEPQSGTPQSAVPTLGPPTPSPLPIPSPSPTPSPLPTPADTPTPAATPTQTPPPPTAPPMLALTCANGVDNGGGTGTICEIAIELESATVLECHGAAGDPRAACMTTMYLGRVTSVTACDGTANGGGATLRCSVTGVGTGSNSVTLCVGSGAGGTLVGMTCTRPETAGIQVSLCNGSANGGGALITCSVEP